MNSPKPRRGQRSKRISKGKPRLILKEKGRKPEGILVDGFRSEKPKQGKGAKEQIEVRGLSELHNRSLITAFS